MTSSKRSSRSRRQQSAPGWLWMTFGFGLGLVVALLVYIDGRAPRPEADDSELPTTGQEISSSSEAQAEPPRRPNEQLPTQDESEKFDFYEVLPQFEVVVPEIESTPGNPPKTAPVEVPGRYVLQAGSFRRAEDAERQKANLALLGIQSTVQVVRIDSDTFHRVRIGPISELDRLNDVRRRLLDADVDTLLMQLSD